MKSEILEIVEDFDTKTIVVVLLIFILWIILKDIFGNCETVLGIYK